MHELRTQTQEIPVKVYRAAERVTIAAPMPGLEPQDIHVHVGTDGTLVLDGAGRGTLKGENDVIRDEWTPGPYHREIALTEQVDGPAANVTYNNGVAVVVLPIAATTRAAELRVGRTAATHGETVGNQGQDLHAPHNGAGQPR